MKEIEPINTWLNGQTIVANFMSLTCISDNLLDTAIFNYSLLSNFNNTSKIVTNGTLIMSGSEYETDWNNNNQAWDWAAKSLNLTFVSI